MSTPASAGPTPTISTMTSGVSGTPEKIPVSDARASAGGRPRSSWTIARFSSPYQGTSSSGAGAPTTATRPTSSGCRAASASATRPPADHPTTPARAPVPASTAAASSAASPIVVKRSATGAEPP